MLRSRAAVGAQTRPCRMSRPLRPLAVLLALLALVVGSAACGSGRRSGDKSSADAGALIKDTFGAGHPIRSGRVDATLDVSSTASPA